MVKNIGFRQEDAGKDANRSVPDIIIASVTTVVGGSRCALSQRGGIGVLSFQFEIKRLSEDVPQRSGEQSLMSLKPLHF
ncbi:hypothetical protein EVAR_2242_1 [Eumeta japonica]|uniref:Uncharacterized protein n=1 Tax=Eumeta variegata TaxID=151549 RepID=A0A4C1SIG4_EUMVA|nr:hypothetical protein EVAR_2242_1 [Eumeta japonica]